MAASRSSGPHGSELAAFLHRDHVVAHARHQVHQMIGDLVAEGAQGGRIRDDVPPAELASYCLHALTAAGSAPSKAAIRRLVAVTLDGLRPPPRRLTRGR